MVTRKLWLTVAFLTFVGTATVGIAGPTRVYGYYCGGSYTCFTANDLLCEETPPNTCTMKSRLTHQKCLGPALPFDSCMKDQVACRKTDVYFGGNCPNCATSGMLIMSTTDYEDGCTGS